MPSHAIPPGRDRRVRPGATLRRGLQGVWRSLPRAALILTALQVAGLGLPSRGSGISQLLHMIGVVLLGAVLAVLVLAVVLSLPVRIRRWAGDAADPRPRLQYVLAGLCLLGIAACIALLSLHAGTGLTTRLCEAAFTWSGLYGLVQLGRAACRGRVRRLLWWPPFTAQRLACQGDIGAQLPDIRPAGEFASRTSLPGRLETARLQFSGGRHRGAGWSGRLRRCSFHEQLRCTSATYDQPRPLWKPPMSLTAAEQAAFDHLVAAPGRVTWTSPPSPGGWAASTRDRGGAGADPATVRFLKSRAFPGCQLHEADFATRDGQARSMVVRTWQEPDGSWAAELVGGGGGGEPRRSRPWVNFTAGWNAQRFSAGGHVIGHGAEAACLVRLSFADGTTIDDTVGNGVVLFFASPGVSFPARVKIFGAAGNVLAEYDEFTEFADCG
jgi:hypothetical protein